MKEQIKKLNFLIWVIRIIFKKYLDTKIQAEVEKSF
jgi:hypothetical protein